MEPLRAAHRGIKLIHWDNHVPATTTGEHVSRQNKNVRKLLAAREHSDRRIAQRALEAQREKDRLDLIARQEAARLAQPEAK